ncbi:hypothetical protein [Paenibacillus alba]|uniref:Uncharacterized protein n=1 Tax=Paenibacillus alba TaxID=1197127 RepID=A0ABU6GC86_9BACL|nr:hypothetical protein [Paenibacillus alba]MEC0231254.1 hypothetical protein [Paenibacillus alba]
MKQILENPIIKERIGVQIPIVNPRRVTAECSYKECRENVYAGDIVIQFDEDWFCNERCLCKHMGAIRRVAR